ncbi:hypothetical protein chiPu_0029368, partial [Chiloscyllium punctatum]|nr:hypothetical protein [Chiloscyllium punctatum]
TAGIPGTVRAPVRARPEYREQAEYRVRARPEYREQAGYQSEHGRNTGNRQGTGQSTAGIPGTGRAPVRAQPEYREQAGPRSEHGRNTGNRQGPG